MPRPLLVALNAARRGSCARAVVTAVVALALLLAQWAGQAHRIAHPNDPEERVAPAWSLLHERSPGVDDGLGDTLHDCAAYDAAALGAGPPLDASASALPCATPAPTPVAATRGPGSVDALGYSPRAPPRA
jgi:hypothetical protein